MTVAIAHQCTLLHWQITAIGQSLLFCQKFFRSTRNFTQ